MVEKNEEPLLQIIRHEVQNHLHVCYTTSGAHNELAQGMRFRRLLGLLFTTVSLMFVCLNYFLTYKFM